ncbi:Fe-S protein assembly co-chaperone HscB [Azohydromonas caseinilytica]|uniref:Co-chaperone protein HscB homolog n=1 Tax=Azohydromonas caseinilytica TaxID=2728836 RepID=A0A848FCM6_9BURK|nr:Fe-S protein assembly co-chaperone HscB [Azohydromonas caseinilytica]NML16149.1 Fe-S protein assembly co-chaperone HscB [Azohydromonas caseinilytica]
MNLAMDDFTLFGLPQRFALDRAAVDERWRTLQARMHPDHVANASAAEQQAATQWAVRINEARERLGNPVQRAFLLCELRGVPMDAQAGRGAVPLVFLARQMAWREALDEARDVQAVERLDAEVAAHERETLESLHVLLDERDDAVAAAQLAWVLSYVVRLREAIASRLEALEA